MTVPRVVIRDPALQAPSWAVGSRPSEVSSGEGPASALMATLWKAPPHVLAIMLSVASTIGVVGTTVSFSLAYDLRATGETVTAIATSDMQGSGRASLSRVDVRFMTQDGQVVDTTLEEPAEYLTLGDEVEIVYDPDYPWDATAVGDESRPAWTFALITVVLVIGALWEWARWANGRWPDSGLRGAGRQTPGRCHRLRRLPKRNERSDVVARSVSVAAVDFAGGKCRRRVSTRDRADRPPRLRQAIVSRDEDEAGARRSGGEGRLSPDGGQQFLTGLQAVLTGPGAHLTVLVHVAVRGALVSTSAAGDDGRLEHRAGDIGAVGSLARQHASGGGAHVGAVEVRADAGAHVSDLVLGQAGIGAHGAGGAAREEQVDDTGQLFPVDAGLGGMGLDHGLDGLHGRHASGLPAPAGTATGCGSGGQPALGRRHRCVRCRSGEGPRDRRGLMLGTRDDVCRAPVTLRNGSAAGERSPAASRVLTWLVRARVSPYSRSVPTGMGHPFCVYRTARRPALGAASRATHLPGHVKHQSERPDYLVPA